MSLSPSCFNRALSIELPVVGLQLIWPTHIWDVRQEQFFNQGLFLSEYLVQNKVKILCLLYKSCDSLSLWGVIHATSPADTPRAVMVTALSIATTPDFLFVRSLRTNRKSH
jgi:hypothetical protein